MKVRLYTADSGDSKHLRTQSGEHFFSYCDSRYGENVSLSREEWIDLRQSLRKVSPRLVREAWFVGEISNEVLQTLRSSRDSYDALPASQKRFKSARMVNLAEENFVE